MLHLIVKVPVYNVRTYMTSNFNVRIYVHVPIIDIDYVDFTRYNKL